MQSPVIMAFRKRLGKRGYREISIFKIKDSANYRVTATEPLGGVLVTAEYSLGQMDRSFKF